MGMRSEYREIPFEPEEQVREEDLKQPGAAFQAEMDRLGNASPHQ